MSFADHNQIKALQLDKLRHLIAAIHGKNPFYTSILDQSGIHTGLDSLATFTSKLPFTTKQQIVEDQQAHPPFGSNLTYDLSVHTRFFRTSGTTSQPIHWLDTDESWQWMLDCWAQVLSAAECLPEDRALFAFGFGPFLGFWTAYEAAARQGMLCVPGGGLSTEARLSFIDTLHLNVLFATPTYALRLATEADRLGLTTPLKNISKIIVAGEPGGSLPAVRQRLSDAWHGAKVIDHHGMTEIGPVSYECPARPGNLHIMESQYIAEVIDRDTQQPVGDGELGELVLTNLGRLGSPLLRYRTGDLVRATRPSPCECGRHELLLNGGILGRVDDMVIVRGVNIFPSALEEVMSQLSEIVEYRVDVMKQREMTELKITVEPRAAGASQTGLADHIRQCLREALGIRVEVMAVRPGSLPRSELKAKRWFLNEDIQSSTQ